MHDFPPALSSNGFFNEFRIPSPTLSLRVKNEQDDAIGRRAPSYN